MSTNAPKQKQINVVIEHKLGSEIHYTSTRRILNILV